MLLIFDGTKDEFFPLRISSVNVTKSKRNSEFGHIYLRNHQWKTSFLCNVCLLKSMVNTTAVKQSSFIHCILALM